MEEVEDGWHNCMESLCSGHREVLSFVSCVIACIDSKIMSLHVSPLNLVHRAAHTVALKLLFCVGITFCTFLNYSLPTCSGLSCKVRTGERSKFLSRGLVRALLSEGV